MDATKYQYIYMHDNYSHYTECLPTYSVHPPVVLQDLHLSKYTPLDGRAYRRTEQDPVLRAAPQEFDGDQFHEIQGRHEPLPHSVGVNPASISDGRWRNATRGLARPSTLANVAPVRISRRVGWGAQFPAMCAASSAHLTCLGVIGRCHPQGVRATAQPSSLLAKRP